MRIAGVESTDLFVGTAQRPLQVVRVTLENDAPRRTAATVRVQGPGVRDQGPFRITEMSPGERQTFEIGVEVAAPYQPGSTRRVTMAVESESGLTSAESGITVAEPGVDYFCAGPVWTTPTKPGRPATGLGLLRHVTQSAPGRPWFAIGGISLARLDEVLAAGATRVVVVRAITEADDPAAAARAFARRLAAAS